MAAHGADVQKAVFAALTTALAPVPVYDFAPENAAYPFVEFVRQQILPAEAGLAPLSGDLARHLLYLSVWSAYRGQAEVLGIVAKIRAALHNRPLALDSGTCVLCQIAEEQTNLDGDGLTHMGSVTVRLLVAN